MEFKSGFVSIIGRPNAGKSTLGNRLMGEKLFIVTSKVQTTRHRIFGIMNGEGYQLVLSDTPGILKKTWYKLHEKMMDSVKESLEDCDVLVVLADIAETADQPEVQDILKKYRGKVVVVINKVDLGDPEKVKAAVDAWMAAVPGAADYIPVSALENIGVEALKQRLIELLPEHEPYFPADELSDRPERFFISEFVREKALELYREEIPYSIEVQIEEFKESEDIIRISAVIVAEKQSQKGILIGPGGKAIKELGIRSRKQMEAFLAKKVYLELRVKVREDWRNNPTFLKSFGYESNKKKKR